MIEANQLRDSTILGRKQELHQGGVAFVNKKAFEVPVPSIAWAT